MKKKNIAIKVEGVSKRYRIGLKEQMHDSMGATILSFVKSPIKNYVKHRSLYKFDDIEPNSYGNSNSHSNDIIWALNNVSFEVEEGEVVGIIGRNGAGKSTLLKILCRITNPTRGFARISGRISRLVQVSIMNSLAEKMSISTALYLG
jgi:lipopolysaccharide transport system ATP-binding protein